MKASRRRLKTIQLETDAGGRTHAAARITLREGETEEKITFYFCGNDFEAVKAHSEETARTSSLGVRVSL